MPSINEQIRAAELFIDNMEQSTAAREAFATIGRGSDFVQEGRQLLEEVLRLHAAQQGEYGEQYGATHEVRAAREAAHDTYMAHLEMARVVFDEDVDAQGVLGLRGRRRKAFDEWVGQARKFYEELLARESLVAQMGTIMITREDLEAAQAAIDEAAAARSRQQDEMGEAQHATDERDRALDRLSTWVSRNRRLARVLLRHTPQHLEALGIRA